MIGIPYHVGGIYKNKREDEKQFCRLRSYFCLQMKAIEHIIQNEMTNEWLDSLTVK